MDELNEFVTKDTKTAAYLVLKGREILSMRKDALDDYEFVFEYHPDVDTLVREFPLTPFKRYLDIYKEMIRSLKDSI